MSRTYLKFPSVMFTLGRTAQSSSAGWSVIPDDSKRSLATECRTSSPDRWNHVKGPENPADCASHELFPSELLKHTLWWNGPDWLHQDALYWPKRFTSPSSSLTDEERELSLYVSVTLPSPVLKIEDYSSFVRLKRVTAWILRFVHNCRARKLNRERVKDAYLSMDDVHKAEIYWYLEVQSTHFSGDIHAIKSKSNLSKSSPILSIRPFIDSSRLIPD